MKKIILHLDFNSYFASVEQQANPFLRGKAVAVAGKGKQSIDVAAAHRDHIRHRIEQSNLHRTVVTTASKEAKRMGVKTAMSSLEAKRICPELIIIPGDPHKYSEITKRFLSILRNHADAVEQFSTDEAFADLTIAAGDYFSATMIAQHIRDEIKQSCGEACTVSIGIGPNKLIAKLASESVKPNGLTVVQPHEAGDFVLTRDLQDVCGIGPRIEHRLHELGIMSIKALRRTPRSVLLDAFKQYGHFLYSAARGVGDDFVQNEEAPPKSIGHSYTFATDLIEPKDIQTGLLTLCDRVAWRMRRDGFIATHLSVHARYKDFNGIGTRKRFHEYMEDGLELYQNAWKLLDAKRTPRLPIRLLGVSASGLLRAKPPKRLFKKDEKMSRALEALDKIQTRYGSGSWQRASTMNIEFKERTSGWHYDHES